MVDQQALEKKYRPGATIYLSAEAVLEKVFGALEKWILEVGNYRLLLDPLKGYWLYEDRLHAGSWEFTGFQAGEVLFYLDGEELAVRLNPDPPIWEEDGRYDLAEQFYLRLQKRLQMGMISRPAFAQEVEALRLQDREGSWWQVAEDGNWLTWNGTAWLEGSPAREMQKSGAGEDRRRFLQLKEKYFALWQQKNEGKLGPEDFGAALHNLRAEDSSGAWWQVAEDGSWLRWDGTNWVGAEPDI